MLDTATLFIDIVTIVRNGFSNKNYTTATDSLNLARWYNLVAESGIKSFDTIAATFYEHSDEIINFFSNR